MEVKSRVCSSVVSISGTVASSSSSRGVPEMAHENLSPQAFASAGRQWYAKRSGFCSTRSVLLQPLLLHTQSSPWWRAMVQSRCRCRNNKPIKASLVLCSGWVEKGDRCTVCFWILMEHMNTVVSFLPHCWSMQFHCRAMISIEHGQIHIRTIVAFYCSRKKRQTFVFLYS